MFLIVSRMNHIKNKKKRTGLQYQQYCTVLNANQKSIFFIFFKKNFFDDQKKFNICSVGPEYYTLPEYVPAVEFSFDNCCSRWQ